MDHHFTFLHYIPGFHLLPAHVSGAILVSMLLILGTWAARLQLTKALQSSEGALIPEGRMSIRNFFEILAESLYKLTESVIGEHDTPRFFPIIGTLFIFIFACNLLGLIPGFLPPTDNLNTTLALGAFVFIYYNYVGFKSNGIGYLKHFLGPVIWLSPLMLLIELVSHIVRPLSLGLRLRGNISGDHLVVSIFNELTPYFVPVIFYGLGFFVAFVQAFVFCLLTMVYISLSTAHDH